MPEVKQMVARCKACDYSWNTETYDEKRKRKCPNCGKFQLEYIKPEDIDLTKELDKTAPRKIKKIITPEPEPEEPETLEDDELLETEPSETEEEPKTFKTFIPNPVLIITGVGLAAILTAVFLITRRARKTQELIDENPEE